MIHIDGSIGEGGGQVLRSALTLSLLSKHPIHVSNIRAHRPNPGLAPQHLTALLSAAQIGQAKLQGDRLRSSEIFFYPGPSIETGEFIFDVTSQSKGGSAGSVSLVLQTVILPLLLGEGSSRLTIRGGTHVLGSPSFEYLQGVYLHTLRTLGVEASCLLSSFGFYPVGGGEIRVEISPLSRTERKGAGLRPFMMVEREGLASITGQAIAANLPAHIAQRIANRARNILNREGLQSEIQPKRVGSKGPGAGLFLIAHYDNIEAGFTSLGKKGKPSEQVAGEAVDLLLDHHNSGWPVDPHLADQLMLPLLLASRPSYYRTSSVTQHQVTHAKLINLFYPGSIRILGGIGESGEVFVHPVDLTSVT